MVEVVMPKLGLSMVKGRITRWLVEDGQLVEKGQDLFEVETEKITKVIESPARGRLRILLPAGSEVPVGHRIGMILEEGEVEPKESPSGGAPRGVEAVVVEAPVASTAAAERVPREGERVFASPRARRAARELRVDLRTVRGSGPGGRVIESDVLRAWASSRESAERAQPPKEPAAEGTRPSSAAEVALAEASISNLSGVRGVIARRTSQSWRAPHIYLFAQVDMSESLRVRDKLNSARAGGKVTITDLVAFAAVKALRLHPELNAVVEGGSYRVVEEVNLGVAVDVEGGLLVPVVKGANRMTLMELSSRIRSLVELSRSGGLSPDDLEGGTFTVSNLGMFGVSFFTAIINPPQVAILSVGAVEEAVRVEGGELRSWPRLTLGVGADHRVVDGAKVASFLADLRSFLENPWTML